MESHKTEKLHPGEIFYGKEPFDLRLTLLRFVHHLHWIAGITLIGTLLFGGGYYVKNVLFGAPASYETTSTYKVSYQVEPSQSGDYYINDMTWNTYVHSDEFLEAVLAHLKENEEVSGSFPAASWEELSPLVEAKLDSDVHVPSTVVTTDSKERTLMLAKAVEQAMTDEFAEKNEQVSAIRVIDAGTTVKEVLLDVRPVRAVVLSALLSGFFAVVWFLLREIANDDIWLPAALRRRYGLNGLGTVNSPELSANIAHAFLGKKRIAVCPVCRDCDPVQAVRMLQDALQSGTAAPKPEGEDLQWIPVPALSLCAEAAEVMRNADGVLLLVQAGSYTGKPLEYVLEYLAAQQILVTAALLWNADERLIRSYYRLPGTVRKEEEDFV